MKHLFRHTILPILTVSILTVSMITFTVGSAFVAFAEEGVTDEGTWEDPNMGQPDFEDGTEGENTEEPGEEAGESDLGEGDLGEGEPAPDESETGEEPQLEPGSEEGADPSEETGSEDSGLEETPEDGTGDDTPVIEPVIDPELTPEPDPEIEDPEDPEEEDPEDQEFEGDDWEDEEEEEEEEKPQFAGESGTTDFATLPLLELGADELTACAFCEGKKFGSVQKAVMLSYLFSYYDIHEDEAEDGDAILEAAGLSPDEYYKWCSKNDKKEDEIRNRLAFIYAALFKNAENKNTKDRFVYAFRNTDSVKIAAENLFAAASARSIRLPYSKEEITGTVIPKAQHYLELFSLGEKREGTSNVTYYGQGNYANVPYDEGTVADSGCGITSFSMVASELTGLNLGPEVTATWAQENGVNTVTNWGAYWWLAERFGVKFLGQYSGDFDYAVEALKEGKLVIASLHKDGFFTTSDSGHYILLTGVGEDGRITVNDPGSYERSLAGPFEYSRVFGGCIQYWIFDR